jgi:hypothetical protein
MAVLDSALNSAVKSGTLGANPAVAVELPRIKGKNRVKPMVWTKPRVQRWLATSQVPGPVMVWSPKQTGAFLDFIVEERLYALYHLTAFRGLRRGEIAGLPRTEVDLDEALLTVLATPSDDYDDPDDPKSDAGSRTMSLDPVTVVVMGAWFDQQDRERAAAGSTWVDCGRAFTNPDGSPLRERWISERFDGFIKKVQHHSRRLQEGKNHRGTRAQAAHVRGSRHGRHQRRTAPPDPVPRPPPRRRDARAGRRRRHQGRQRNTGPQQVILHARRVHQRHPRSSPSRRRSRRSHRPPLPSRRIKSHPSRKFGRSS